MIDGYGADPAVLIDRAMLADFLTELADSLGMHAIADPVTVEVGPLNKKDSGGVSGFLLIAESHISFHSFPKREFISLDIYTCQDMLDTKAIRSQVETFFALQECEDHLVKRGTRYPAHDLT